MQAARLNGRIVGIQPEAVYLEEVYTQEVSFELQDGSVIVLFDDRMLVKGEMLDSSRTVRILAFLASVKRNAAPRYGVDSYTKYVHENVFSRIHVFCGELLETDEKWNNLLMDIGCGTVEADVRREELRELEVGDFLVVCTGRLDLRAIYDN
jgi:hypothetical protein